jgi:hypothetical protein
LVMVDPSGLNSEFYQNLIDAANSGDSDAIRDAASKETYDRYHSADVPALSALVEYVEGDVYIEMPDGSRTMVDFGQELPAGATLIVGEGGAVELSVDRVRVVAAETGTYSTDLITSSAQQVMYEAGLARRDTVPEVVGGAIGDFSGYLSLGVNITSAGAASVGLVPVAELGSLSAMVIDLLGAAGYALAGEYGNMGLSLGAVGLDLLPHLAAAAKMDAVAARFVYGSQRFHSLRTGRFIQTALGRRILTGWALGQAAYGAATTTSPIDAE